MSLEPVHHDHLRVLQEGPIRRIYLSRPERRNALSRRLVSVLYRELVSIEAGGATRVVVIAGDGPVFCAGADLQEFADASDEEQLRADASALSRLLAAMVDCPAPIIVSVQGAAFGSGFGLVCAADIAIAATDTRFSLSEARLGLVPAVISPFVYAALGQREAKARMLLAEPYGTDVALRQGLIHDSVPVDELTITVDSYASNLLRGAPDALATIKRMPGYLRAMPERDDLRMTLEQLLVERRQSLEGQEGMSAFLEKRSPSWVSSVEELGQ
jgi:methylglutaconyl-CoA hydratase